MSDLLPQAGDTPAEDQASSAKEESELERARKDAAKYRTQLRELEGKWKAAEPVLTEYQQQKEAQKSEAQKAAEERDAARNEAAQAKAEALRAQQEAKLTKLATKANVDLDLLDLIDLSKLDLDDETGTLAKLSKLAAARTTANGASNPGRSGAQGPTDDELRDQYFNGGRNKTTIFGG